jgi:integrase/recombinase XerC
VLGEIQSPVGFEEVRNKLIIDCFTQLEYDERLIHLKISDIDASKFSIKVLGKGIKKESFQFTYYRAVFFVFKERSQVENEVDSAFLYYKKV